MGTLRFKVQSCALRFSGFEDSAATTDFILRINDLIDELANFIADTEKYLKSLCGAEKHIIYKGPRKTFIMGFINNSKVNYCHQQKFTFKTRL